MPVVDKTRGSKSADVQRIWEVYDERLQFMSCRDASLLDESLGRNDVTLAWSSFGDCLGLVLLSLRLLMRFSFSGGPLPSRGLILGRGCCFASYCSAWWSLGSQSSS